MNRFNVRLMVCVALVAGTLMAGSVSAATSVICKSKTGALAIRTLCLRGETRLKNIDALTGEQGEQGEKGQQGVQGPVGPAGAAGLSGGTITGTYRGFPAACASPGSTPRMNGMIGIVGKSFMSSFGSDGQFSIYHVPAGTYVVSLFSLNGTSFANSAPGFGEQLAGSVTVVEGQTTNIGTVSQRTDCCGNGVLETGEICDGMELGSTTTCHQYDAYYQSGNLMCNSFCQGYSARYCSTDPE